MYTALKADTFPAISPCYSWISSGIIHPRKAPIDGDNHRQHLAAVKPNAESGFWVLGGAMLEDVPKEGSPLKITGSVMMAVAGSKEEVMEKIKSDIYADKGVWDMDKVSLL